MLENLSNQVFKKNRLIGLIIGGVALVASILDTINDLFLVGNFSFRSPWLLVFTLITSTILLFISGDKSGDYSYIQRKLARLGLLILLQVLIVFLQSTFQLQNTLASWLIFLCTITSIVIYFLLNYSDAHSKEFVVLFCEFSDAASAEIPKDRYLTHYVRQEISREFRDNSVLIKNSEKVILEEKEARRVGANAGATAIIYGIISKFQKNFKLDLRFSVIREPQFYQPINMKERVLPLEELDTGQLESFVGKDYKIAIDFLLGLFEYSRKNYEQAQARFITSLENTLSQSTFEYSINSDVISLYLGNSHYLCGDIDKAKQIFEKAIEINARAAKIIHNLGIIEFQQSDVDKAISSFSNAISLDANLVVAFRNRGYAQMQLKDYEKALDDLLVYIEQKKYDADALELVGTCYSHIGLRQHAIKYYRSAYHLSKKKQLVFDISDEYFSCQSWKWFLILLLNAVRPKQYSRSLGEIAANFIELKRFNLAILFSSLALFTSKRNPHLYFSRAYARMQLGKNSTAKSDLLKAIEFEPKLADAHYNLGKIYSQLEDYDAAITWFSEFLVLVPDEADGLINRAQLYLLRNKFDQAIQDAGKYCDSGYDSNGEGYRILGYAYLKKGMYKDALAHLSLSYDKNPTDDLNNLIEQLKFQIGNENQPGRNHRGKTISKRSSKKHQTN